LEKMIYKGKLSLRKYYGFNCPKAVLSACPSIGQSSDGLSLPNFSWSNIAFYRSS
jgi:hypothetical protein